MPCLPLFSVCKLTSRPCLISPGTEALQLLDSMGSLICASLAVASCWESRKNDFFCCWLCSWDLNAAEWSEMYRVREGFLGTSGSLALLEHDYLMTLLPSFPPSSLPSSSPPISLFCPLSLPPSPSLCPFFSPFLPSLFLFLPCPYFFLPLPYSIPYSSSGLKWFFIDSSLPSTSVPSSTPLCTFPQPVTRGIKTLKICQFRVQKREII